MAISTSSLTPVSTERVETRWRRIVTPMPVPESVPIIQQLRQLEPRSLSGMPPVLWDNAEGFLVRDAYGNQWIDLTSGVVMANVGHAHPKIRAAIKRTCDQLLLATYVFPQQVRLSLLQRLIELSPIPDSKAILFSAGTEATECAMMLMRRHGQRIHRDKIGIVSFADGYHGRTLAAALATGSPSENDWIARENVGHYQIPFPFGPRWPWGHVSEDPTGEKAFDACVEGLLNQGITPDKVAGFIGEPVPGWATWPTPKGFARKLVDWCHEHNILVCFDEVQCGCGRTGKMWGMEHTGVVPDLFTLGKGLSSSLPVSAVVGQAEILDAPDAGDMSSTHGGNPLSAAAALASLEVLAEENLLERATTTGSLVLKTLGKLFESFPDRILSIHGSGLFIGIYLTCQDSEELDAHLADAVAVEATRRGVLMFTTGRGFLKFTPPLGIDPDAAVEAANVIQDCVRDCIQRK